MIGSLLQIYPFDVKPSAPPVGYYILYIKTDNIIYLQDSSGTEYAFGSVDFISQLTGDVTAIGPGSATATVTGIQGKPVNSTAPTDAQFLVYNNGTGKYVPVSVGGDATMADTGSFTVTAIQGKAVSNVAPTDAQILVWNTGANKYQPVNLSGDVTMTDTGVTTVASVGGSSAADVHNAEVTANQFLVSLAGGLNLNYRAGNVIFNGTQTFVTAGTITVPASTVNGYVYVDITGTVVAASSLAPNTVPLALFTSGFSSVSFLEDARVFVDHSLTWGIASDIQVLTSSATSSAGSSEKYARADHSHGVSTDIAATQIPNQSNAAGSSTSLAKADHVHNIPTSAPVAQTPNNANADGSASTFSRSDHVHNVPTAAPIANLNASTTNSQGSAATFSQSDHSHAIDTAAAATQTPNQVNAPGIASGLSRADHIHNIPTATPVQIGTSNVQGSAASFSNSDHVHAHGAQTDPTLHAVATDSLNGFMSAADKTKLDAATASNTSSTLVLRDPSGNFAAGTITATEIIAMISSSGTQRTVVTKTGAYTILVTDDVILCDATAGSFAVTLPVATNKNAYLIIKVDSTVNTVTVLPNGTDIIDGSSSKVLSFQYDSVGLQGSGSTQWYISAFVSAGGVPVTTVGTYDGNGSVANGLSVSGYSIFAQSATAANPGMVNTGTQTMAGNKTLNGSLNLNTSSTTALVINTTSFILDSINNALGIGIQPSTTTLIDAVNSSGSAKPFQITCYGVGSNGGFRGRFARGTSGSPTAAQSGDRLNFFSGRGYGATAFAANSTGAMNVVSGETFSDTSMATYLQFLVTPTGSVTSAEAVRINSTGNVLIGTTTDNGNDKLQVNGGVTIAQALKVTSFALTDAANIATDASKSNNFTVTLGGNRNLSAPTNPTDFQRITYRITQDATGSRGLTFDPIFTFGLDIISFVPSTGANKTDYIGCIYNGATSKWNVVAVSKGF